MRSESRRAGAGSGSGAPSWRDPEPGGQDESGEWGPRDWCASGVGGASFDLTDHGHTAESGSGSQTGAGGRRAAAGGAGAEPDAQAGEQRSWDERVRTGGRGGRRGGRRSGRGESGRGESGRRDSGERGSGGARAPRSAGPSDAEADPAARARDICLRLLTGTAKTRKQLADALRKREIPDEVAEEVLARFEDVGLIDDAAFAAAWVETRHAGRGLARRALAQELRTRGVAGAVVEEAVAGLDPDEEVATARALVDRKLRSTAGLDRQVRMRRLVGMLARRGYAEGLAFRAVREALDAEGESTQELEDWSLGDG
ncbi:regulatory protein [Kitasatospora sp. MAP12-15]|uniref:recombination regulator RecX n=1 Tax=unclassified Kitasatospora TaxID=2633591 RepID=UPI0024734D8F|nr:recombination regulator RecX [Kitasatospora sp. MAP12-44]MDH6113062.1 regulatory protein [Kitasatospora sp. MAP12-44]